MLFDLIDQIYDAALSPERWPAVLSQVSSSFGAACSTIVPFHNPSAVIVSPGLEEGHDAYARHWWQHDIISQAFAKAPQQDLNYDWAVLSRGEIAKSAFYQEFRRPFGMGSCISLVANRNSDSAFGFSVHLSAPAVTQSDASALQQFAIVSRHVSRAFGITQRTSALLAKEQALANLLSQVPYGIAFVDDGGRVVMANAALNRLASDGLRIVQKDLRAAHPNDQPALDRLIRRATGHGADVEQSDVVLLARPSGRRPLMISAIPLARRHQTGMLESGLPQCRAMVVALDLDGEQTSRIGQKLQLLDLTPAEARLAAQVGAGRSPRGAAAELGITESTARSCLRQVYEKLSISRQSELARLIGRLSLLQGSDAG